MSDQSASPEQRAFLSAAEPSRYFPAGAIEEARRRISRCVARDEGVALLIGAAGTGKTLLLEVLASEFKARMSVVPLIGAQLCTRRALLQMILFELGMPYRDMDEGELRLALHEHLKPVGKPARRMLLLVDEADSLPMRLLEEVRALTNLAAHGTPLVSIVLAGRAILEEMFADPKLDVFAQRLATRCYLSPLTRDETFSYVRSQVAAVNDDPDELFAEDALDALHSAADGVPRLINQLGDQLMWIVDQTGCRPLDAALVQQAWSDLQQLPAPWETQGESSGDAEVIEFGELDDADSFAMEYVVEKLVDDAPPDLDALCEYDEDDVEMEEESPASISIDVARDAQGAASLQEISDSIDATEELLSKLDETEPLEVLPLAAAEQTSCTDAAPPLCVNDPFGEPFDDEEVVIDQYTKFESALLSLSQRVMNFGDQTLASELAACQLTSADFDGSARLVAVDPESTDVTEVAVEPAAAEDTGQVSDENVEAPAALGESYVVGADMPPAASPMIADDALGSEASELDRGGQVSDDDQATHPASSDKVDASDSVDASEPDDAAACCDEQQEQDAAAVVLTSTKPGELLVVEDDDTPSAQVIAGRNFRRLFSCLESGESLQQFGSS